MLLSPLLLCDHCLYTGRIEQYYTVLIDTSYTSENNKSIFKLECRHACTIILKNGVLEITKYKRKHIQWLHCCNPLLTQEKPIV